MANDGEKVRKRCPHGHTWTGEAPSSDDVVIRCPRCFGLWPLATEDRVGIEVRPIAPRPDRAKRAKDRAFREEFGSAVMRLLEVVYHTTPEGAATVLTVAVGERIDVDEKDGSVRADLAADIADPAVLLAGIEEATEMRIKKGV